MQAVAKVTKRHGSGKYRVRADSGAMIRAARLAADMTQLELGKLAFDLDDPNAAKVAVSRLENGEASYGRVLAAAGALGLGWEKVIEFVPDE